jgi:hypothetical protein
MERRRQVLVSKVRAAALGVALAGVLLVSVAPAASAAPAPEAPAPEAPAPEAEEPAPEAPAPAPEAPAPAPAPEAPAPAPEAPAPEAEEPAPEAPAPAAAGITWYVWASTLTADDTTSICLTGSQPFSAGQTLEVQVAVGSSWVPRRTFSAAALQNQWCVYLSGRDLADRPGRYAFRAVSRIGTAVTEARATLTLAKSANFTFTVSEPLSTTTATNRVVRADVPTAGGQIVYLQRASGTQWVNVSTARAPRTGAVRLNLAVPARPGSAMYRVINGATTWSDKYVGPPFSIHQTDMGRYGSYIAAARRTMALNCPHTPVYVDTPAVAAATAGNRIGYAVSWWSGGRTGGSLTSHIELRAGMTGKQFEHTVQHECAHVVQARAVVQGREAIENSRALQFFGANGREAEADCMAFLAAQSRPHLYYIRDCSAAQQSEARRVWHAYGRKYQAATYTW